MPVSFPSYSCPHKWVQNKSRPAAGMCFCLSGRGGISTCPGLLANEKFHQGGKSLNFYDGGYTWIQKHSETLTHTDLAIATAKWPICQQQRPTASFQYSIIPWNYQMATWLQVTLGHSISKGQWYMTTGINTYSKYRFAFPTHKASVKTTIGKLKRLPYSLSWYSTQQLLNKEIIL